MIWSEIISESCSVCDAMAGEQKPFQSGSAGGSFDRERRLFYVTFIFDEDASLSAEHSIYLRNVPMGSWCQRLSKTRLEAISERQTHRSLRLVFHLVSVRYIWQSIFDSWVFLWGKTKPGQSWLLHDSCLSMQRRNICIQIFGDIFHKILKMPNIVKGTILNRTKKIMCVVSGGICHRDVLRVWGG